MRKFGIEIEMIGGSNTMREVAARLTAEGVATFVAGYTHAVTSQWKIVSDGSVQGANGMELVSPILEGDEGLAQVRKVGEVLTAMGCTVNRTTGMHVHVDARDLTVEQIKNVLRIWCKYESNYDSILPASRRGDANMYCRSVVNRLGGTLEAAFATIKRCRTVQDLARCFNGRYYKINLEAYSRHGTLEFRGHSGTVDATKLVNWTKLVTAIVCRATETRCVKPKGAGDFTNAFRHAGGEVMRWARKRAASFDANGRPVRTGEQSEAA